MGLQNGWGTYVKKILSIVIALALLGGGGAGAYFYFMKPAEASAVEGDKSHAKKQDSKDKADTSKHIFVELDPLILPIIDESGVTQTVSLVVALEVADEKAGSLITAQAPRLKDAYIQKLYGVLNNQAALKGGVIQVNTLKKQLNKISNKVLGDDIVHDVLLQVVQQRPV